MNLLTDSNENVRAAALRYLLDNMQTYLTRYGMTPVNFQNIAFVPAIHRNEPMLAKPSEVRVDTFDS